MYPVVYNIYILFLIGSTFFYILYSLITCGADYGDKDLYKIPRTVFFVIWLLFPVRCFPALYRFAAAGKSETADALIAFTLMALWSAFFFKGYFDRDTRSRSKRLIFCITHFPGACLLFYIQLCSGTDCVRPEVSFLPVLLATAATVPAITFLCSTPPFEAFMGRMEER